MCVCVCEVGGWQRGSWSRWYTLDCDTELVADNLGVRLLHRLEYIVIHSFSFGSAEETLNTSDLAINWRKKRHAQGT